MSNHEKFVEYVGDILRQCAATHSRPLVNLTMTMNHVRLGHHPETGQSGYLVEMTGQMEPHFVASSELGTTFEYEAICADTERLHNTMQDQYAHLTGRGETADSGQGNEAEFEYRARPSTRVSRAPTEGKPSGGEDVQSGPTVRQPAESSFEKGMKEYFKNQPTVDELMAEFAASISHVRSSVTRPRADPWSERDVVSLNGISPQPAGTQRPEAASSTIRERTHRPELELDDDGQNDPGEGSELEPD